MDLTANTRLHYFLAMIAAAIVLSACTATSDINTGAQSPSVQTPSGSSGDNSITSDSDGTPGIPDVSDDNGAEPDIGGAEPDNDLALVENASSVPCDAALDDFRDTMLAMVNHSRQSARQCGTSSAPAVGQVQWNDQLTVAAVNHANDMVSANFFSHTGSNGLSVADRAEAAGYDWRAVGENIAAGQRDIAEVHQGWLDSAGHCRNIMNAIYTEIGAACVTDSATDFGSYWVVVFGDQR